MTRAEAELGLVLPLYEARRDGIMVHLPQRWVTRSANPPYPGWWQCQASENNWKLEILAPATPWEREEYLAALAPMEMLLLQPGRFPGAWEALPVDLEQAQVPIDPSGPLLVWLVEQGQPFERIIARIDHHTYASDLIFDHLDRRVDPADAEYFRAALARRSDEPLEDGLIPAELMAYAYLLEGARRLDEELSNQTDLEAEVRAALALGGAALVGLAIVEHRDRHMDRQLNVWRVMWQRGDYRGVTLLDTQLEIADAGICVWGVGSTFDLTSLISVVMDRTVV